MKPSKRAQAVEREWLKTQPPAVRRDLRLRDTRRDDARVRDALTLEHAQAAAGAKKPADARRKRARDAERARERSRKRPYKHLPAGLVELRFRVEGDLVRHVGDDEDVEASVEIAELDSARESTFMRVDEQLADDAARLQRVFDVEAYRADVGLTPALVRMLVRPELADAIRAAVAALDRAWVGILVELARDALLERVRQARGAKRMVETPSPATTAAGVLRQLRAHLRRLECTPPRHVDEELVAWVLDHLAVGTGKGGRGGKLNAARMREHLSRPR